MGVFYIYINLQFYIPCVFCVYRAYALLKVVTGSHYDLSVLSMSVMGFPIFFDRAVCRRGEIYPVFIWIFVTLPSMVIEAAVICN